jgi:hypothetical protein
MRSVRGGICRAALLSTARQSQLKATRRRPSPPDNLLTRLIFARGLNTIRAESQWRIGFDGTIIDLPAGERTIQFAPKLR